MHGPVGSSTDSRFGFRQTPARHHHAREARRLLDIGGGAGGDLLLAIAYRCADRTKDLPYLLLHWSNCEARVDSTWPSDQTRKVTGELVLAGDYHQFALIDKAYIRAGRIHRASRFWVLDQCLKFHVETRWVPFLR